MNLCTNSANGTSFISSKEMSDVSHTSEVIFELVDKAIEDIFLENVVTYKKLARTFQNFDYNLGFICGDLSHLNVCCF